MLWQRTVVSGLAACGVLFAGCAVTNYESSSRTTDVMKLSASGTYNIASAETVSLKAFDENGRLPATELKFLTDAINNHPGFMYGDFWKQAYPKLDNEFGYLNIRSDDTADMKLTCRSNNPIVFDDSPGSIPIQVKTILVLSPEVISSAWTTSYVLSVSMSPMKKYCYGALLVAVMDDKGKTIDTRVIGLYRSSWFSALFPTALFACGKLSASGGFFRDMTADNKALQTSIVVQAVTEIVCAKSSAAPDPKWKNIRSAVVESLAIGNTDAATKLLKSAQRQNIGGDELKGFLDLLGI